MLTPQKIEEYSYNRIVDIYNQLSVDICSDIIERVSAMGNITQTTEDELRILLEINGQEVFEEVLIKTSMLDDQTKEELRKLYETMVKEDMKDYKPLYEYRGKEFKLTKNQIRVLNKGIEENNKIIRNFTNSVAFNSKQTFIDSVDEAYLKVASGAMGYDKAIEQSYKKIASTGLKITDKAGRKVALDVAVRRSILTGIQQTANLINFETGKILGCDGYEVTAHIGARPTHAVCQGLQYAEDKETAEKYHINWWYDDELVGKPVAELWVEPNCRHSVFPIIVGINEPTYSKQELAEINNATVMLNGKEMPVYEANQEMRKIERNIRNYKREIDTLKQANVNYSKEQQKLRKWQQEYTRVSNETGIPKYYDRIKTYSTANIKDEDNIWITKNTKIGKSDDYLTSLKLNEIPSKYYNNIINIANNSNSNIKTLFFKNENKIKIKNYQTKDIASINNLTKNIRFNANKDSKNGYSTFFHEFGHLLDYNLGTPSQKNTFKGLLNKEFNDIKNDTMKQYNLTEKQFYKKLSEEMKKDKQYNPLSDIIGGITQNKCLGKAKHEIEYWEEKGKLEREFFAHMGSATIRNDTFQLDYFTEFFPKSVEYYKKIIGD